MTTAIICAESDGPQSILGTGTSKNAFTFNLFMSESFSVNNESIVVVKQFRLQRLICFFTCYNFFIGVFRAVVLQYNYLCYSEISFVDLYFEFFLHE